MKERIRQGLRRAGVLSDPFRETIEGVVDERRGRGEQARLLDVGCGNHSPARFKAAFDVHYTGADIQEYHIDDNDRALADELVILDCGPDAFTQRLGEALAGRRFDVITMRHVLEHLEHPLETLTLLTSLLDDAGTLYLSFPCEASTSFPPGANSTLNFHDDPTHVWLPDLVAVTELLEASCVLERVIPRYRGGSLVGLISRGLTFPQLTWARLGDRPVHVNGHTWRAVGFETIIVARRTPSLASPSASQVGR